MADRFMAKARNGRLYSCVVIGASAGGLTALRKLLDDIDSGFPIPIVCVQHLPEDSGVDFCAMFRDLTKIKVVEAQDKMPIERDMLYLAAPGYHLLLERDLTLALSLDDAVNCSRPSIDVLFESAAHALGEHVMGIVLTGCSRDGADGLGEIHAHGGLTIVEDPETAEYSHMPRCALAQVKADWVLSLEGIGQFLREFFQ